MCGLTPGATARMTPLMWISIQNEQDRGRPRNILKESCYHCIKCSAANFLIALMWIRPWNNVALAAPTHRGPKRVFDGTKTQVKAWMINKWRAKIVQRELYNGRDLP